MNIVFMGTPDFAVPTLQAIIDSPHNITAVYTRPDKKQGRGHHMLPTKIKELATSCGLAVYQPTTLRSDAVLANLKSLAPDLIVVVAYGMILPRTILELPKYGCINVHASLLPKYRGAGPIQWSVLNGEAETGATTMFMADGIDTGDMLLKCSTPIGENETASELHDRLAPMGAKLLIDTLVALENGTLNPIKQDDSLSCHAPMLTKEMSALDISKNATALHHQICGLSEWPCASITIAGKRLKIYKSAMASCDSCKAGELLSSKRFIIGCGENTAIEFIEVQYEGSKRMAGGDFLRGQRLSIGANIIDMM